MDARITHIDGLLKFEVNQEIIEVFFENKNFRS